MANPSALATTSGLSRTVKLWRHSHRVHPRRAASLFLARTVLERLARTDPSTAGWRAERVLANLSEFRCVRITADEDPVAILKLAGGTLPRINLGRNGAALRSLGADPRLGAWNHLIPSVVDSGTVEGNPYLVEEWVQGMIGDLLGGEPRDLMALLARAAAAIGDLRTLTARPADPVTLDESVHRPVAVLARSLEASPSSLPLRPRLEAVATRLEAACTDRPVAAAHSDFWLGNVFFAPDGNRVTGIIDWAGYRPAAVADVDLVTLVLTARLIRRRGDLGDTLVSVLRQGWETWERGLLTSYGLGDGWSTDTDAALLAWLWLVAGNTEKDARFSARSVWFRRNVRPVLELF